MLYEGQQVELTVERAAAGGRMIARHHGQVILVRGAIPGERIRARIERADRRVAYAATREVVEASADRRPDNGDPLCGGALYSHIAYPRQLALKSDVIRDAFARLGRYRLEQPVDVAGSPERGYRMRARFHVHGGRTGFYREGTHQLCDPATTQQLIPDALDAVTHIAGVLERDAPGSVVSIAITENIAATERAAHLELGSGAWAAPAVLEQIAAAAHLTGTSARGERGYVAAGDAAVSDPLRSIAGNDAVEGHLRRHAESFFQANRYLLRELVAAVTAAVAGDDVLDLYAGVGLFSIALAALGRKAVTAVEGDRISGADLRRNARAFGPSIDVHVAGVEDYLASRRAGPASTVIVDPPRTGLSKGALGAVLAHGAPSIVYVSCDPATLARDTRRLLDNGYALEAIRAFDLFPNTAHVETLVRFVRRR